MVVEVDKAEKLLSVLGIDEKKKSRLRRCKRKFLAVKMDNGAVRLYGSYNKRCSKPLAHCVFCRDYLNIDVLIPKMDIERKGIKRCIEELPGMTWGNARKLVLKYVLPNVEELAEKLESGEEVRIF